MEEICRRYPLLADKVFKKLDYQSLANIKMVSRKTFGFLENGRILWKQIIMKNIIGKYSVPRLQLYGSTYLVLQK